MLWIDQFRKVVIILIYEKVLETQEYQGYRLTDGYKRDVTDQEEQDIARMGAALAAQCGEDKT